MTLFNRVEEAADKLAEWFGLTEREVNWVRSAKAGNDEDGSSEALLGVDGEGWFPLRVRASEYEASVVGGSGVETESEQFDQGYSKEEPGEVSSRLAGQSSLEP